MDPMLILGFAVWAGYTLFEELTKETKSDKSNKTVQKRFECNDVTKHAVRHPPSMIEQNSIPVVNTPKHTYKSAAECFRDEYVSFSRLATYCRCPRKFKYVYLGKMQAPEDVRYTRGKAFHSAVENFLKCRIGQKNIGLNRKSIIENAYHLGYLEKYNQRWSEKQRHFLKQRQESFQTGVDFLCNTFPVEAEIVAVEQKFTYLMKDINIHGIVDLILKYPDGHFEIVDYKTGRFAPIKEQLEIYSFPLLKDISFSKISYRFICVDRKCHYLWETDKAGLMISTNKISELVGKIAKDDLFLRKKGTQCSTCYFRRTCEMDNQNDNLSGYSIPTLTNVPNAFKWRPGSKYPKSVDNPDQPQKQKHQGKSFKLVRALNTYLCLATRLVIRQGEYHFANKHGQRYCIDAFISRFPDTAKLLLDQKNLK